MFVSPLFPLKSLIYSSLINKLYYISFFIRVFGPHLVARKRTGEVSMEPSTSMGVLLLHSYPSLQ